MFFKMHASCIIVKGALRSTICDLDRNDFHLIPNTLADLLLNFDGMHKDEVYRYYGDSNKDILDEYFEFLQSKDLIFFCQDKCELSLYPPINFDFLNQSNINNAIIDIDPGNVLIQRYMIDELKDLGCQHLQIRFFKSVKVRKLKKIISMFDDSNLSSIEVVLPYSRELTKEALINLYLMFQISNIQIHSTPKSEVDALNNSIGKSWNIIFFEKIIENETHCGVINPHYFNVHISLFSEAKNFNTCLNRKISIDQFGNIKNCPSMPKSYGNISDTKLSSVYSNREFQSYWAIKKDEINICKSCEFRYICSDCRVYIQNNDLYGKPSKCQYDPFSAKWNY